MLNNQTPSMATNKTYSTTEIHKSVDRYLACNSLQSTIAYLMLEYTSDELHAFIKDSYTSLGYQHVEVSRALSRCLYAIEYAQQPTRETSDKWKRL